MGIQATQAGCVPAEPASVLADTCLSAKRLPDVRPESISFVLFLRPHRGCAGPVRACGPARRGCTRDGLRAYPSAFFCQVPPSTYLYRRDTQNLYSFFHISTEPVRRHWLTGAAEGRLSLVMPGLAKASPSNIQAIPLGRIGRAEEVAAAVCARPPAQTVVNVILAAGKVWINRLVSLISRVRSRRR